MIYLKIAFAVYLISVACCIHIGRWIAEMDLLLDNKEIHDLEQDHLTPFKPVLNTFLVFLWLFCFAISGFNMKKMKEDWHREVK